MFDQNLSLYKARVYEKYLAPVIDHSFEQAQKAAKPLTVLVIEDNPDEWFLERWAILQQFPHVDVQWASNPQEITAYLKEVRNTESALPKLIILDLYLPTAQIGLGVLRSLKTHPLYQRIPIITVSRSNDNADVVATYNQASSLYIVKPDSYEGWKEKMRLLDKYWSL